VSLYTFALRGSVEKLLRLDEDQRARALDNRGSDADVAALWVAGGRKKDRILERIRCLSLKPDARVPGGFAVISECVR